MLRTHTTGKDIACRHVGDYVRGIFGDELVRDKDECSAAFQSEDVDAVKEEPLHEHAVPGGGCLPHTDLADLDRLLV